MSEQEITEWWSDAWSEAYERRANALGPIPSKEHRKMVYAMMRMDQAFEREQAFRDRLAEVVR